MHQQAGNGAVIETQYGLVKDIALQDSEFFQHLGIVAKHLDQNAVLYVFLNELLHTGFRFPYFYGERTHTAEEQTACDHCNRGHQKQYPGHIRLKHKQKRSCAYKLDNGYG